MVMVEHGLIDVAWKDNFLFVDAQGAFNPAGIARAKDEINLFLASHPAKSTVWYRIDLLSPNTLPTQENIQPVLDMYMQSFDQGCGAAAIVSSHEKFIDFALKLDRSMQDKVKNFSDLPSAKRWLDSL